MAELSIETAHSTDGSTEVSVAGSGNANATVKVVLKKGAQTLGQITTTADSSGNWTATVTSSEQLDSANSYHVVASDANAQKDYTEDVHVEEGGGPGGPS